MPSNASSRVDIEHIPVDDDPRKWSPFRKNIVLFLVSSGSMIAGFCANIQNPSVKQIEEELPATSSQFSLSISLFILFQGCIPLFWAAVSEIKGRRTVYLVSLFIFTVGSAVAAVSKNVQMFIALRCVQAIGSSAVMTLGATTLADIFDVHERATKMGIYYIAPLLGPSVSPIIGGGLTSAFNWRATFWFLTIVGGSVLAGFLIFFRDTFRKERSITYQSALKHRMRALAKKALDQEKGIVDLQQVMAGTKLSVRDVNPILPIVLVMRRINNVLILIASGITFAFTFVISYSSSRTLSRYYNYSALQVGLVLLSFGIGTIFGSVIGGRWSDYQLAKMKAANNNVSVPEMRLKSVFYGLFLIPPATIGFGWVSNEHVHIAGVCAMLFLCGFSSIFVYAGTLAYIVDANAGRSSAAVSLNSSLRGLMAFIATEVVVPLQDGVGDGWMYTIFGVVMAICSILIYLTGRYGEAWREAAIEREMIQEQAQAEKDSRVASMVTTPRAPSPAHIP